jgi:hypothetical protein
VAEVATTRRSAIAALAAVLAFVSCARDAPVGVLVPRAAEATAMVALPDGGLLYGERSTGRIRTVDGDIVARVSVVSEGERGLLGLAVDPDDRLFAAWTRRDGRIVVAQVDPGPERIVWLGPPSVRLHNGGHIAWAPDDALVIGIGDLEDPGSVSDLEAPHGKLLRLDPSGPPDQKPENVSYGWNNPFAFGFTPSGDLWLADNAPGKQQERLLRADPVGPHTVLPERTAPSGLAAVDDNTLVVCGYRTRHLLRYRIGVNRVARLDGPPLARDCRLGVVLLSDGRLAYSTESSIRTVRP